MAISCLNFFILALFLSLPVLALSSYSDSNITLLEDAWLRFCDPVGGHTFTGSECPNGIWLKDHIPTQSCVCVQGLWLLTKGLCDKNPLILYGQGHCFSIDKKVHRISYLGNLSKEKSNTLKIVKPANNFFYEVYKSDPGFTLPGNQTLILLRSSSASSFQVHGSDSLESACLQNTSPKSPSFVDLDSVQVIKIDESPANMLTFKSVPSCSFKHDSKDSVALQSFGLLKGQGLWAGNGTVLNSEDCAHAYDQHTRYKRWKKPRIVHRKGFRKGSQRVKPRGRTAVGLGGNNPQPNMYEKFDDIQTAGFFGYNPPEPSVQEKYTRLVNEQNLRVIKIDLNYLKFLKPLPDVQYRHPVYRMLQTARSILNSVCPTKEVPISLTKAITRLFRYILVERANDFPYGDSLIELEKRTRIEEALEKCYRESTPYEFRYKYSNDHCRPASEYNYIPTTKSTTMRTAAMATTQSTPGETGNEPSTTTKPGEDATTPPVPGETVTKSSTTVTESPTLTTPAEVTTTPAEATTTPTKATTNPPSPGDIGRRRRQLPSATSNDTSELNTTVAPPSNSSEPLPVCTCRKNIVGVEHKTLKSSCSSLPGHLAFDFPRLDLITETMWKVFQFVHYHCASYFKQDPEDLSILHERIERFFSTDVLYRWLHPGNNQAILWKFFFFGHDLRQFIEAIDVCVCAAHEFSPYKDWTRRPKIPTVRKKRTSSKEEQTNEIYETHPPIHSSCITQPWDPYLENRTPGGC